MDPKLLSHGINSCSVQLPIENGKNASLCTKFPSLSRKWPGLN